MAIAAAHIRRFSPYWASDDPELGHIAADYHEANLLISVNYPWAEHCAKWNSKLTTIAKHNSAKPAADLDSLQKTIAKLQSMQPLELSTQIYLDDCIAEKRELEEKSSMSSGLVFAMFQPQFSDHKMKQGLDSALFVFGRKSRTAVADFVIASPETLTISHLHFAIGVDRAGFFVRRLHARSLRVNGAELTSGADMLGLNPHEPNVFELGGIQLEVLCCRHRSFLTPFIPSGIPDDPDDQTQSTVSVTTVNSSLKPRNDLWYYPHRLQEPEKNVVLDPWMRQEYLATIYDLGKLNWLGSVVASLQDLQLHNEYMVPTRIITNGPHCTSLTPLRVDIISLSDVLGTFSSQGCPQDITRRIFWCLLPAVRKLHSLGFSHGRLNLDNLYLQGDYYWCDTRPKIFLGVFSSTYAKHCYDREQTDCYDLFQVVDNLLATRPQSLLAQKFVNQLGHHKADKFLQEFRSSSRCQWKHNVEEICTALHIRPEQVHDIWSSVTVSREFVIDVQKGAVLARRAESFILYHVTQLDLKQHVIRALSKDRFREAGSGNYYITLKALSSAIRHLIRKYNVSPFGLHVLLEAGDLPNQTRLTLPTTKGLAYHPRYGIFELAPLVSLFDSEERKCLRAFCSTLHDVRGSVPFRGMFIPRDIFNAIVLRYNLDVQGDDIGSPARTPAIGTWPIRYLYAETDSTELLEYENSVDNSQWLNNLLFPEIDDEADDTTYQASTEDLETFKVDKSRAKGPGTKRLLVDGGAEALVTAGSRPSRSESTRGAIRRSEFVSSRKPTTRRSSVTVQREKEKGIEDDTQPICDIKSMPQSKQAPDIMLMVKRVEDQAVTKRSRKT